MTAEYTCHDIAKMIDLSLLNPTFTADDMEQGFKTALEYDVASVCILPCMTSSPRVTPNVPVRSWYRQVSKLARVGAQNGLTLKGSKRAPDAAKSSSTGVSIGQKPYDR